MNLKADLHTHSSASPDGGITADQYRSVLAQNKLDVIAITDHNRIDFAQQLQAELGQQIIVGEEIMTTAGEIVGLFLTQAIPAGLSPQQTITEIQQQGGVVYIPHPFETVRKGLHPEVLEDIADDVDILEVCNGRAFFQNRSEQAVVWTRLNNKAGAASSDAHGVRGLGATYTSIAELPTAKTLTQLVQNGVMMTGRPTVRALLYPKLNRLRKKVGKG
jgi:predicted metal-dependent phosphoesterase TrpH